MDQGTDKLCGICELVKFKYICPKCGIPYCSLNCYRDTRKHIRCSESFYRDCVKEEVKSMDSKDPEQVRKMKEILQRVQALDSRTGGSGPEGIDEHAEEEDEEESGSLDSDDDEPLEARLSGLNLDDSEAVWKSLTPEEREDFKRFVCQTQVENVIPEWTPWWNLPVQKTFVQEVIESEQGAAGSGTSQSKPPTFNILKLNENQPDIFQNIKPMVSLTKIKPSNTVKLCLANVIASYAWISRLYGGDLMDSPENSASGLITLSSYLLKDQVFSYYHEAIKDVEYNALQNPEQFDGGPRLQASLNEDVFLILTGGEKCLPVPGIQTSASTASGTDNLHLSKSFVLSALTECAKVLEIIVKKNRTTLAVEKLQRKSVANEFKSSFPDSSNQLISLASKDYRKAKRKVEYLLSFANEFSVL